MNGNMELLGGGQKDIQKVPETWHMGFSQDSIWVTLAEMCNNENMEPKVHRQGSSGGIGIPTYLQNFPFIIDPF